MNRTRQIVTTFAFLLLSALNGWAGVSNSSVESGENDDEACVLRARNLHRRGFPSAHFSGITHLGGDRYALVSDKEPLDGYYPVVLHFDSISGQLLTAECEPFRGTAPEEVDGAGLSRRDCEGVAYVPTSGTLFISGEGDQAIREYRLDGLPTGRRLAVPPVFARSRIHPNYGFEALTNDTATKRIWTNTENALRADEAATASAQGRVLLRLQSFGDDLQPATTYAYLTDAPRATGHGRAYAFGVPALAALPDGRLVVMEREFRVSPRYLNSWVTVKLYVVRPQQGMPLSAPDEPAERAVQAVLDKHLIAEWTTRFHALNTRLANYEGLCLGPCLADGRQTILLVSDAQGGMGRGRYKLKDYLRVVILPCDKEKRNK